MPYSQKYAYNQKAEHRNRDPFRIAPLHRGPRGLALGHTGCSGECVGEARLLIVDMRARVNTARRFQSEGRNFIR